MPNAIVRASATALPISSRRLFLAAGSAAAVFATVKRAAGSTGPADPIFAAIERHKQAWRAFSDAVDMADGPLADEQGREVTAADEAAYEACNEAEQEALAALLALPPITVAGARAAIEHVLEYDDGCEPETVRAFTLGLLNSPLLAVGGANV